MKELTQAVKDYTRHVGATLVGVGNVERFEGAPRGHGPKDFVPEAKSVVSVGLKITDAIVESPTLLRDSEIYPDPEKVYTLLSTHMYMKIGHALLDTMLSEISYKVSLFLEGKGYRSLSFPTTYAQNLGPYEPPASVYNHLTWFGHFWGPFSHRHAAVRCGLGEFGYNNIVITKEYGPRIRLNSVITEAELEPDPLVSEPICLRDKCNLCIKACPTNAISLRYDLSDEDNAKPFITSPCNPTKPYLCKARRFEFYKAIPVEDREFYGDCLRVCPIGKPRYLNKRLRSLRMGPIRGKGFKPTTHETT
jgi:epoxyqueuosine reductase QueG